MQTKTKVKTVSIDSPTLCNGINRLVDVTEKVCNRNGIKPRCVNSEEIREKAAKPIADRLPAAGV
jgi:hypothetical protein